MEQRAFTKCRISYAMGGSKDSALYENNSSDGYDCELGDGDNVYADDLTPAEALCLDIQTMRRDLLVLYLGC